MSEAPMDLAERGKEREYELPDELYAQVIEQLRPKFGTTAETVFDGMMNHAITTYERYLESPPPTRSSPMLDFKIPDGASDRIRARMEERQREMMQNYARLEQESNQRARRQMRAHVLEFFVMDNDVPQSLAEQIVDNHIIVHG